MKYCCMNIVENNPYRVVGILSNVSARDLQRQKGKISKYASIGKEISSDLDFDFLDEADRSESDIQQAFSRIEQNQDKVYHSLYWLSDNNKFDELAITYLKKGDREKAISILEKITEGRDINSQNFSSFNNVGTLKLLSEYISEIKEGVEIKIKLIESDHFKNFVHLVADETCTIDSVKQTEKLVEDVIKYFEDDFDTDEIFDFFSNCSSTTQSYLSGKFTEDIIHRVEKLIESTKRNRKIEKKSDFFSYGNQLVENSKSDLKQLASILGKSNLKYKLIADNLAKEILQCGIDYFKDGMDHSDPSKGALKLLSHARRIARGTQIKIRIEENIDGIKEWAETAPIKEDIEFISNEISTFQLQNKSVKNARGLLITVNGKLENIRRILGANDVLYVSISSAIVGNVLEMLVNVINTAQLKLEHDPTSIFVLSEIVSEAKSALALMANFDMDQETRSRYLENKMTLASMDKNLEKFRIGSSKPSPVSSRPTRRPSTTAPVRDTVSNPPSTNSSSSGDYSGFVLVGVGGFIGFLAGGMGGLVWGVIISLVLIGWISD
jgi:tetratricopeptide (TPR) repeat protein